MSWQYNLRSVLADTGGQERRHAAFSDFRFPHAVRSLIDRLRPSEYVKYLNALLAQSANNLLFPELSNLGLQDDSRSSASIS